MTPSLRRHLPLFAVPFAFALLCPVSRAAPADAATLTGTWDLVSETPDGDQVKWSLTFKNDDSGKLTATASSENGDIPVKDLKLDGDTITFTVSYQDNDYEITLTVSGTSLTGKWSGNSGDGSIKGAKRAAT